MTTFRLKMTTFVTDSLFFLFVSANPRIFVSNFLPISPIFSNFSADQHEMAIFFINAENTRTNPRLEKGKSGMCGLS